MRKAIRTGLALIALSGAGTGYPPAPKKGGRKMRCVICGQRGFDGALDESNEYVCVDCWANGRAEIEGRQAVAAVPADTPYYVYYPPETLTRFVNACNKKDR